MNLKSRSSENLVRQPYGQIERLDHVPIALYEILSLAAELEGDQARTIESLTRSIIKTTIGRPLSELANLPLVADLRKA